MKILSMCAVILFSILSTNQSFAQKAVTKETIKVWGNCGMCKNKIEKAAKSAGATSATWNEETKQLKLSYPATKTSSLQIQQAIAKAGYDTRDLFADTNAYNALNACCQYERKDGAKGDAVANACCNSVSGPEDGKTCAEMPGCKGKDCCKM